jgi:hypothetical protein
VERDKRRLDWPGKGFGIRGPEPWETPLSIAEVKIALEGLKS